jgi:hypothetical protein
MTLFGQKTDTSKVDSIVNNHLRKLLESPVARKSPEETAAPEAVFASAVEPSASAPATSDATVVTFVDTSLVVAPEVEVEPMRVSTDTARVAVYVVEEPVAAEPAPLGITDPISETPLIAQPAAVCTQESEPEVVEPVAEEPIVAPVIAPAVSEVAASLANDLARCLAGAFQNLQQHIATESQNSTRRSSSRFNACKPRWIM